MCEYDESDVSYWWSYDRTRALVIEIIKEHPNADNATLGAVLWRRQEEADQQIREYVAAHPELLTRR